MSLGLLFDLDGTMVLSDPVHFAALRAMLVEQGRDLTEEHYYRHLSGGANPDVMRQLFPEMGEADHIRMADRKEELFRAMAAEVQPVPGLYRFLDRATAAEISIGVVTNAPRLNAELLLTSIGLAHLLSTIVIGVELPRGKPDPLPFLTGLERMGLNAAAVLAFEDSLNGVRSAASAGIAIIGVRTGLDDKALRSVGAAVTIADLQDARLHTLIDVAASQGAWPPLGREIPGVV